MKTPIKFLFPLLIATGISTNLMAEEATECTENCPGEWTASTELGYVSVSGNTDTDTFNGRFSLGYEIEKWRYTGFIASQTSSSTNNTTPLVAGTKAEKYTAQAKSDYKFSKKGYFFGVVDFDDTKGSGFDYQASYAIGLGYSFLNDKVHKLNGELGLGSRTSKLETMPVTVPPEIAPPRKNVEGIVRIAGNYKWKISKTSNFEQLISSEIGDNNKIAKSHTALSSNLLDNLSMKVAYDIKHQSDVPVGSVQRETVTSFTVVYSF